MWTIGSYTKIVSFSKKYRTSFKTVKVWDILPKFHAWAITHFFLQWKRKYTGGKVSPMINRVKEIWILKIVKHFVQKLNHLTFFELIKFIQKMQDDTSIYAVTRTLQETCEPIFSFSTNIPTMPLLNYSVKWYGLKQILWIFILNWKDFYELKAMSKF